MGSPTLHLVARPFRWHIIYMEVRITHVLSPFAMTQPCRRTAIGNISVVLPLITVFGALHYTFNTHAANYSIMSIWSYCSSG